jgi:cyclase
MLMNRVVPVLLLSKGLLVKTVGFRKPRYVGDPINAVRIFNEKEVDELVILDMDPCRTGGEPRFELIEQISGEAFMPVAYGGGVRTASHATQLTALGVEKVVINSAAATNFAIVSEVSGVLGSQAVVGGVDYRTARRGRRDAYTHGGKRRSQMSPVERAVRLVTAGAGEIFLHDMDRDGQMAGFNTAAIAEVAESVPVPVLACGGAGKLSDLEEAISAGASAVAAASMFVFHGRHRAVLISYPDRESISKFIVRDDV